MREAVTQSSHLKVALLFSWFSLQSWSLFSPESLSGSKNLLTNLWLQLLFIMSAPSIPKLSFRTYFRIYRFCRRSQSLTPKTEISLFLSRPPCICRCYSSCLEHALEAWCTTSETCVLLGVEDGVVKVGDLESPPLNTSPHVLWAPNPCFKPFLNLITGFPFTWPLPPPPHHPHCELRALGRH